MRKRLILLPAAEEEASDAREWYDLHAERVAPRFVAELRHVFDEISERPQSFARFELRCRAAPLKTFPYYVVFRELDVEIVVVAVFHVRRRPRYWRSRLSD